MKLIFLYLFSLLSIFQTTCFSQVTAADCINAVNICQNANFSIDPNGSGATVELQTGTISNPSTNPASSNSGCLLSGELNPTWMIINVAGTGNLQFSLGQDGGSGCFDWIMWPYTPNACTQILNNQLAPIRCNWNGACEGFTGIANPLPIGGDPSNFEPPLPVTAGQQFLLCLSNFSSQTTDVPLNFFGNSDVSCTTVLPVLINSASICPEETVTLTASAPGATSYTWSPGGQTTASITVNPTTTTTYTCAVTGVSANGESTAGIGNSVVTVLPLNNSLCSCTITASNTGPVCVGDSYNVNATNLTNGTYEWFLNGTSIGSTQNLTNIESTLSGSFTYNLIGTDAVGHVCNSSTTVIVNPLPIVNAGSDTSICRNTPLILTATGANLYSWSNNVQNAVSFVPSISGIYSVIGTDQNGCQNTDELNLTFLNANSPLIFPDVILGCKPLTVNFQNNLSTSQNCLWDFGNGTIINSCSNQSVVFNEKGCFNVTISHLDNQGCDTSVTFPNIVCVEEAKAQFTFSPGAIGPGNNNVLFNNSSEGATSYLWFFGDGNFSTEFEPSHEFDVSLQNSYFTSLVAFSPFGCPDTAKNLIPYQEQLILYIPNSFTPESDEHNQTFSPVFTSGFDPFNYEMKIYNRWGELIFESLDHTIGWDGTFGASRVKQVGTGIYCWVIKFKLKNTDEKVTINGFVNVLK